MVSRRLLAYFFALREIELYFKAPKHIFSQSASHYEQSGRTLTQLFVCVILTGLEWAHLGRKCDVTRFRPPITS